MQRRMKVIVSLRERERERGGGGGGRERERERERECVWRLDCCFMLWACVCILFTVSAKYSIYKHPDHSDFFVFVLLLRKGLLLLVSKEDLIVASLQVASG